MPCHMALAPAFAACSTEQGDHRRLPGSRAIIWLDVDRVGTSCGYSVPFFDYVNSLYSGESRSKTLPRPKRRTILGGPSKALNTVPRALARIQSHHLA
jgi:hypothetical protein